MSRDRVRYGQILARLWSFARAFRALALALVGLLAILVGVELVQPLILKVLIDEHMRPRRVEGIGMLLVLYGILILVDYLARAAYTYLSGALGVRATCAFRRAAHEHLLGRRMAFFDHVPVGRIVAGLIAQLDAIQELLSSGLVVLIGDSVRVFAIIIWLIYLEPHLAFLVIAGVAVVVILFRQFPRLAEPSQREHRARVTSLNEFLHESLAGVKILKLHRRETRSVHLLERESLAFERASARAATLDASLFAIVEAVGSVVIGVLLWYGGPALLRATGTEAASSWLGHGFTLGLLVAFIDYVARLFIPIRNLSAYLGPTQSALVAASHSFELLDEGAPDMSLYMPDRVDTAPIEAATCSGDKIAFEDVSFSYSERDQVLERISFGVATGTTLAIVGATGSGKSTVVKLLARFYSPTTGRILLDGRPLDSFSRAALSGRIAFLLQDVGLFRGTVFENLAIGARPIDREAAERACARLGILDRLVSRGGLDAIVEPRGSNFSLGERQLLAFARAMARDPEVLVLDEATASLDRESERLVEESLATLLKGRTTIIIAHRFSTVRHAQAILALAGGVVAEYGTHDELLQYPDGVYARLHALQECD